jgi:hypothetical protein
VRLPMYERGLVLSTFVAPSREASDRPRLDKS